jgi:hypothetical protein
MALGDLAYQLNSLSTIASQTGFSQTFAGLALFSFRNIGGIVADVTLSERHQDRMIITQHPIETGSTITDHAYKLPISVIINAGWSNSTLNIKSASFLGMAALNVLQGGGFNFGDFNYIKSVYKNLLAIQQNAIPFTLTTGKRQLQNMLIEYISEITDERTENSLILEIGCREAIMVFSQSVQNPAGTSTPVNQSNPWSNGTTIQQGQQSLSNASQVNQTNLNQANIPNTAAQ